MKIYPPEIPPNPLSVPYLFYYKLIGNDIDAEDMGSWVLAIYAFLEQEKGNIAEAKTYLDRAKKNGFNRLRFETSFGKSNELRELTINGLLKLGNI